MHNLGLDDGAEIYCKSVANPPANVTWERVNDNDTSVVGGPAAGSAVLLFPKLMKEDAGLYRCTASNEFGTVTQDVSVVVKGSIGLLFIHMLFLCLSNVFFNVKQNSRKRKAGENLRFNLSRKGIFPEYLV